MTNRLDQRIAYLGYHQNQGIVNYLKGLRASSDGGNV